MSLVLERALEQPVEQVRPMRVPSQYSPAWAALLVALDLLVFAGSAAAAALIVFHRVDTLFAPRDGVFWATAAFIGIWVLIFARVGLYRRSFALSVKDEFYFIAAALSMGVVPLLAFFTLWPSVSTSRLHILLTLAISFVAVSGVRTAARAVRGVAIRNRPRRVAIVGRGSRIDTVTESLNLVEGSQVLRLEVDDLDSTLSPVDLSVDPDLDGIAWFEHAKAWGAESLILTEVLPPDLVPHLLEAANRHHIKVAYGPPRVRFHAFDLALQQDGQQALIVPSQLRACQPRSRLLKRLIDFGIALIGLALVWPFMLLAAVAIYLESGGPILYRQRRVGRNGVEFDLLKFRSMPVNAEAESGPVWASAADGRATRVGAFLRRTSIDEFPQFFNVLRGEMSIVGPRPERPAFVSLFRQHLPRYDERHLVRPGITGWAQVHMTRVLAPSSAGQKLAYDLFYVEHWGLVMDGYVIFKTAAEFLFHRVA
jgi:exopolysaccharide biosynthesis polyprenyl glycosylphosphotransferase